MIVYKATNKINGRCYIGVTTQTLEKRRYQHELTAKKGAGYVFHAALRKHGFDAFEWEVLDTANNTEELYDKERHYIKQHNAFNEGYNLTLGGECPTEGLTGERHHLYGTERPDDIRRKIATTMAKITEEQAFAIVKLIKETDIPLSGIARMYGISRHIVANIARGKSWTFLYDEPPIETRNKRKGASSKTSEIDLLRVEVSKVLGVEPELVDYFIKGRAQGKAEAFLRAILSAKKGA
jgi:GIY-YIG catalytic domain